MSVDLDELEDWPQAADFRRANGAPMVRSLDGRRWERYSRPSTWGRDLDEQSALNYWRIDRAIEGVAASPALAAKIAANLGIKEGRRELREEAISIGRGEEAADLGTALHKMAHRVETDTGYRAVEPFASDLACYLNALDQAGLESVHCEVHLCADAWRAAGTADRIYRATRELHLPDRSVLEPGQLVIGDLKTGKRLDYSLPGFCIQLAIYADGVFYDVETDERTPLPDGLHTGWGLLVHIPAGQASCEFHWLDLEVGRVGGRLVQGVREWRQRDDFAGPFAFPPSDEVAVLSSGVYELEYPMPDQPEPAAVDFEGEWLAGMLPWAQARINQIGLLPEPRALLIRRWPEGVAPLREATPSPLQLAEVLDLLDQVESAFSLPFPDEDPRVAWNLGKHRSDVVRGNQPFSHD